MEHLQRDIREPYQAPSVSRTLTAPPVVWALDAFSDDVETHVRTAEAIRAHAPESSIHPVYVLSEEMFSGRGYSSFLRAALKPRAHKNLQAVLDHEWMSHIRRSGALRGPRVLIETSAEVSLCTGKLLRYAKHIGAKLVAVGTTGRSALSRWFAGSFAETLLQESPLPLLMTGPRQARGLPSPRSLVLPTDFQFENRAAFENLLHLALQRDLSVHLVHQAFHPFDHWIQSGVHLLGGGWVSIETFLDDAETRQASEAAEWQRLGRDLGLEVSLISDAFGESMVETVLTSAAALENPFIALLESHPRPGHRGLPASLTRDLIRSSPYPIYISGHTS